MSEKLKQWMMVGGILVFLVVVLIMSCLSMMKDKRDREYADKLANRVIELEARVKACDLKELKAWARKVSRPKPRGDTRE